MGLLENGVMVGMLTDTDLKSRIVADSNDMETSQLRILEFDEHHLTPVGYDLRVGKRYASTVRGVPFRIDKERPLSIKPGETVLVETLEDLSMPQDRSLSALILSKVSIVSKGISHVATTIDPDWHGHLLIALTNHAQSAVNLRFGQSFCTVVFLENKSPSTKQSGHDPGRSDVLLEQLSELAERRRAASKRTAIIESLPSLFVIACFVMVGYLIFGDNTGLAAMAAVGVAVAPIVSAVVKSTWLEG